MNKTKHNSSMRLFRACWCSLKGLRAAFRNEMAFRQEILCFVVFFPLGMYLGRTPMEKIVLSGSLLLVLITELLNSSIEAAVDRVSEEIHPLSGRAKDMGSAAVFIALANVMIAWGILLFDMFI